MLPASRQHHVSITLPALALRADAPRPPHLNHPTGGHTSRLHSRHSGLDLLCTSWNCGGEQVGRQMSRPEIRSVVVYLQSVDELY